MLKTDELEIPLSKLKLSLALVGSITFVVGGTWFVTRSEEMGAQIHLSPTLIFIIGIASILFFGVCAFFIFKKIGDNKPGLIINSEGIIDNSSGTSIGLILWKDIMEI